MIKKQSSYSLYFMMVGAMIIWGLSWTNAKILGTYTDPLILMFWRFVIAGFGFLPILPFIKKSLKLSKENFEMMRPANRRTKKGYYLNHVYVHSHFSLFYTLKSTLNVCILALDEQCDMTLDIKNIKEDVKTVLEFAKNLIPSEEGNYLDEMRELMLSDQETKT